MTAVGTYRKQSLFGGWTRVDLLLQIYDKAIGELEAARDALSADDGANHATHLIKAQKAIVAIHAGLKPDEYEVAYNIARLLHFVLVSIENRQYDDALKVLTELRDGFSAVSNEVNELERSGEIPPMQSHDQFESIA